MYIFMQQSPLNGAERLNYLRQRPCPSANLKSPCTPILIISSKDRLLKARAKFLRKITDVLPMF
jgi:hypothetical protein